MSLREELERVVSMGQRPIGDGNGNVNEYKTAIANLIRDHGQALLDALDLLDQLACCAGQDCGCRGVTTREVAENLKESAAIVADAERYRWLRSWKSPVRVTVTFERNDYTVAEEQLDTMTDLARSKTAVQAIDAAIKGEEW